MGRRGDKPERHSIYEFEDTALDLAQVYRFSTEFPAALRSEDYKQYLERQKADRQHLENLADRWLEAEEKVETRIKLLEMQNHGDIAGLENSSLDMLKRFYNTVTEYVDAEAEFRENFEQDLEDPVFLTDILHEDDLLEKTVDTLNDIEKIRNQYITEKDYDFFRGY